MATEYRSDDIEDVAATQNSVPLDFVPPEHPMLEGDNESSDEYCKETDTHHPLAELVEQFWQLKSQFISLKSTTHQSTSTAELIQLIDKIQHLTMMLQLHSAPSLVRNQCTEPCRCTQTPCMQPRENEISP